MNNKFTVDMGEVILILHHIGDS